MTRLGKGLFVATALSCMATLRAQTPQTTPQTVPTSTTDERAAMSNKARDVSVTGCLVRNTEGRYLLTNARIENTASESPSTSTAGSSTTGTTGAATSTTARTSTTAAAGATTTGTTGTTTPTAVNAPATWALAGGSDLDKHVGHRIQVMGRTAWDAAMNRARASGAMPPAAGTTTAGTTASTAATSTSTTAAGTSGAARAEQPQLDVQSVKMISPSCS